MDPTRIQIFRNCQFELTIPILDAEEFPVPLNDYTFSFAVAPTPVPPTGAFGTPVLNQSFSGSCSGAVTYVLDAIQTASLAVGTAYQYAALGQAPGQDPFPLQYGSVQLIDVPAMA